MPGGAAAGAIVARMTRRAEEVESRIKQPRFLQADEHRVRAIDRAQPAVAEPLPRAARFFQPFRNADLGFEPAAALKDSQHVARLAHLVAGQGIEKRQDTL